MRLAPITAGLALAAVLAVSGGPSAHAQSQNQNVQPKTEQTKVVIKDGDTLDGIATDHQTTYVRLYDANTNIQDPDVIYPGDKLRVPSAAEQLPDRPLPADAPAPAPTQAAPGPSTASAPVTTAYPAAPATVAGCGDNSYANYIYMRESGCNLNAVNASGCRGIGQACPGSKLPCGADYACQNAYFTSYAAKYGGWAGAYAFWVAHGWW
jgi:LysM repeat protein